MTIAIDTRSDADEVAPRGPAVTGISRKAQGAHGRPLRITLFGLFGCGNFGNDGSLETMLDFLRATRPDARLLCICANPSVVRAAFDIDALPIRPIDDDEKPALPRPLRRLLKILRLVPESARMLSAMRRSDIAIIPGTGILDDFGEWPFGMPMDLLRWCLAARLAGTRLAFVSIGAGPIDRVWNRRLMVTAARLAHYRSYRDRLSKTFLETSGLSTAADPIFPDIVFKLKRPDAPPRVDGAKLTVGVGVMSYYGWYGFEDGGRAIFDAYIARLVRFVIYLLDRGHGVRLLTGELGDATAVDALRAIVRRERPELGDAALVFEPAYDLNGLMKQIAETDIVVATRYHNIICALKMGKPTISLGYSKKNDVVMAEFGLAEYCQHVEHFDGDLLISQFETLAGQRAKIGAAIEACRDEQERELECQERRLSDMLDDVAMERW
ncbi:polysaccharide pyruvyl transferase family protein [Pararhizobium haloflavum]|uniref:polysaccharide pyruvyl transferase family protein n=1 Tax=Pararhizobium haloflavum TaxID=2037914 RepID=UPI000C186422|nr:polysaccharide pyruvyl transferase family protein [Pararhizobium haloflavum]